MIDPARQQAQLRAVADRPRFYDCPGCGKPTRDRRGSCISCRRLMGGMDMTRLSFEQLTGLVSQVRVELKRRSDMTTAAMREVK